MRPKKHVVILQGGMSSEYEVSLKSGANVQKHLDKETYRLTPIEISREGEWKFPGDGPNYVELHDAIARLKHLHPDCVLIALHGPFGEDGRIQGLLDLMGIPYTGSGCAASAIAMDKSRTKKLVGQAGLTVADQIEFTAKTWDEQKTTLTKQVADNFGFPCVVKSPRQGSSLGMGIPRTVEEFSTTVAEVLGFGYRVMVERFVHGTEITCGVLDVDDIEQALALPVTEIRPVKSAYFDYHAKYTPNATREITPAEIPDTIRDRAQQMVVMAHEIVGCRGFSRTDMIVSGDDVVFLEINTIPGMTETSLYPQAVQAAGMTFTEFLGKLVEAAIG